MRSIFITVIFAAAFFILCVQTAIVDKNNGGKEWAVLVAGSHNYFNYRHHADICHSYQIMHARGIPDERIIVMMFDDIATDPKNVYGGKIYNKPDGPDVYKGVLKDYVDSDVSAINFHSILLGKEDKLKGVGSGKVLKSGPEDRLFIHMAGHGTTEFFCFPGSFLQASDFVNTLKQMHEKKMYKEMVIYLDSCESGSMFADLLPSDINIYAATASEPTKNAYACYYDNNLEAYLGDLFSVGWMEDTDENDSTETFKKQFDVITNKTCARQTPMAYGDLSIQKEVISNFFSKNSMNKLSNQYNLHNPDKINAVNALDIPIYTLEHRLKAAVSEEQKISIENELFNMLKNRRYVKGVFEDIVLKISQSYDVMRDVMSSDKSAISERECYQNTVQQIHSKCFNLGENTYALQFMGAFARLCNLGYTQEKMTQVINTSCDSVDNAIYAI